MEGTFIYAGGARLAGKTQTRGGIFRLRPGDDHFEKLTNGMPEDNDVYTITIHPQNPEVVFAGTRLGLYRSRDRGDHWQALGLTGPSVEIWSLLVHPDNPRLLYAGASPVAVFRSDDNGDHWRRLPDPKIPSRVPMPFACRVMRLAADPHHPHELYAVLEVNGVMRSRDGGESWEDCSADLIRFANNPRYKNHLLTEVEAEGMLDGHALCVGAMEPVTVYLAVRMGLFRSTDRGLTWSDMEIGRFSPLTYGRDIRIAPQDSQMMYACLSPARPERDWSDLLQPGPGCEVAAVSAFGDPARDDGECRTPSTGSEPGLRCVTLRPGVWDGGRWCHLARVPDAGRMPRRLHLGVCVSGSGFRAIRINTPRFTGIRKWWFLSR
jgi:hypothetical protein